MPLLIFISTILEFIGTIMIAFTALRVHHRFLQEHKVDEEVFSIMKREQMIGFSGVALLTTGFLLHLIDMFLNLQ